MNAEASPVVFWDWPQIFGWIERDETGHPVRLYVYPDVPQLLKRISADTQCGVVADSSEWTSELIKALLETADIGALFTPGLLQPLPAPISVESLVSLGQSSSAPGQTVVFASVDYVRRAAAMKAGMRAVPHRDLVEEALRGEPLTYIRVSGRHLHDPVDSLIRDLAVIPAYRTKTVPNTLYAVTSYRLVRVLSEQEGCEVETFGRTDEPAYTEAYLVRDCLDGSHQSVDFRKHIHQNVKTFRNIDDGLFVALDSEQEITEFHPPRGAHGHTLQLHLTRSLLSEVECDLPVLSTKPLSQADADVICRDLNAALIDAYLWPWTGKKPLPGTTDEFISSRYVNAGHNQNNRVAIALSGAMQGILGNASTPEFTYSKKTLHNVEGRIEGTHSQEIVVVGAHLDSFALGNANDAPGVDDDATGIAAVLAAAKVLRALSQTPPRRGIRFVLFNAEEVGFAGSIAYVRSLLSQQLKPVAMIQMDMVGLATAGSKNDEYEIHPPGADDFANSLSKCVRDRIAELVDLIVVNGQRVNDLKVETFPLKGDTTDPFASRSDHQQFLTFGHWPACLVCENAFSPLCKKMEDCNHDYHTSHDLQADTEYVAAIARAVAATIWVVANA